MEVVLNVTSYHRLSPEIEATKTVEQELTFGRSDQCDWHLPDPEKVISGQHGKVVKEADGFYVYDYSTNGLFINYSVSPLGKENKHLLSDGDVLSIGDFQIEAKLSNQLQKQSSHQSAAAFSQPNPSVENYNQNNDVANSSLNNEFTNGMDEAMIAPSFQQPQAPISEPVSSSPLSQPIPEDWDEIAFMGSSNEVASENSQHLASPPVTEPPVQVQQKPAQPRATQPAKAPKPVTSNGDSPLVAAFLEGLGVNSELANELNDERVWAQMGESLRHFLVGSMDLIRQRSLLKNQLKLNHTTFQVEQNNPLKFSATLDDAIQNLFIRKSSSYLQANKAVQESFIDTKAHEKGLLAGATGALSGALEQLSPDGIKQQVRNKESILNYLPTYSDSSSWDIYQKLHAEIIEDVETKGVLALSEEFLRAYNNHSKA